MRLILFFAFLLSAQFSYAQKEADSLIVYLKDGRYFPGRIYAQQLNFYYKIKTDNGNIITIPSYHIKRIKKKTSNTLLLTKGKTLRTKGYYNVSYLSYSGGLSEEEDYVLPGLHFHTINGYQFKPQLATGIGIGVDFYADDQYALQFVPLYAELRGAIGAEAFTPYYALAIGYGIGYKGVEDIDWGRGGFYLHSQVGIKLATRRFAAITIGLGLRIQQFDAGRLQQDVVVITKGHLRRFDLIVGWMF